MSNQRAVCVGIDNYAGPDSLNGCVNDATAWSQLLQDTYGFAASDCACLLDRDATKRAILTAVEDAVRSAGKGGQVVLTFSCHGSYAASSATSRDATYREGLCGYDLHQELIFLAELGAITQQLPPDTRLLTVLDTCFNGTATRVRIVEVGPGIESYDDRRVRFHSPALRGQPMLAFPWTAVPEPVDWRGCVLFAAGPKEYAYDAFIDGQYRGALSRYATKILAHAKGSLTPRQLERRLANDMGDYPQHPYVAGPDARGRKRVLR